MIPQQILNAMHLLIENYADNSQLTTSELYDRELLVEGYRDGIKDTLNCTDLLEKAGWVRGEDCFKIKEAYDKYISVLAEENFILRRRFNHLRNELFDPTTHEHHIKLITEARNKLGESLEKIIQQTKQ